MKIKILKFIILFTSLLTFKSFGDISYTPFSYDKLKNRSEKFLLVRTIIGQKVVNPLTLVNIMEDKRLNPADTLHVLFLNAHDIPEYQLEAIAALYDDGHSLIFNLQTDSENILEAFSTESAKHNGIYLSLLNIFNNQISNPAYTSDIIKSSIFHNHRYSCALDLDVRLLQPLEEIDKTIIRLLDSPYFLIDGHYLDYPADPFTFRDVSASGQFYLDAYYRGQYTEKEYFTSDLSDAELSYHQARNFQWHSITVGKGRENNTFTILSPAGKTPLLLRNEMDISEVQKLECTRAGIHYLDNKSSDKTSQYKLKENILNEQIKRAKDLIDIPQGNELYGTGDIKIIEKVIHLTP